MVNYYIAVLIGSIIFLLLQLNGVVTLPDFKWSTFLRSNIVTTIVNLCIGCALVFVRDEIQNFYPITLFSALILGISGQAIFKKVTNAFNPEIETKIGFNNKPE